MATTPGTIWQDWFPEERLANLLAGYEVEVDIGHVNGVWRRALEREVRSGRLTKWRGHWFPVAGASFGLGQLKTCYGTAAARDALPRRAIPARAA